MPACVDQIIVVDDASDDGTAQIARACGDRRVLVVRHQQNRGVGAAIASGYLSALQEGGGARDVFAVMAGDGQMHPDDLRVLVEPVASDAADYVKGDRFRSAELRTQMPMARYVGGVLFSKLTSLALGIPISDSQCGYTAIARDACAQIDLAAMWPRYGYPNDLLGALVARGLRIAERPVRAIYQGERSGLRLRHLPVIAALIVRAGWRLRRASPQSLARQSLSRT